MPKYTLLNHSEPSWAFLNTLHIYHSNEQHIHNLQPLVNLVIIGVISFISLNLVLLGSTRFVQRCVNPSWLTEFPDTFRSSDSSEFRPYRKEVTSADWLAFPSRIERYGGPYPESEFTTSLEIGAVRKERSYEGRIEGLKI